MKLELEERATAGKRIKVMTTYNGTWHTDEVVDGKSWGGEGLERLIQYMSDKGFNFAGKVDEYIPTGSLALHTEDFLFIRAE